MREESIMQMTLNGVLENSAVCIETSGDVSRGQVFTPRWFSDLIIRREYGWLGREHCVVEPTCGTGSFLQAIPSHVSAIGVEIDPVLAARAKAATPHRVIQGDFRTVELPGEVDLVIGNPPFCMDFVDDLLERSWELLRHEGQVALILPAYTWQTANRVCRYAKKWSISSASIPRNIFTQLKQPLVWARFIKDDARTLVGFMFYEEVNAVNCLPEKYRQIFISQDSAPLWPRVVEEALVDLGGEGDLSEIYRIVEGRKPTENTHWRAQIRKVLQTHFHKVSSGRYSLALN
ncbi:hypothetical protein MnBA_37950 [Marinobacterium sp. BA1]